MEKDNFYLIATSNSRKFPKNTSSNFEFELDEELDLSGCQVGVEKVRFQSVQKNIGNESIVISEKRIKRKLYMHAYVIKFKQHQYFSVCFSSPI